MRKDLSVVRKLAKLYIAALTAIALLVISGELLMQHALDRQSGDSRVVNIAGRQRMLSQKLSKEAMRIRYAQTREERENFSRNLGETLGLWQKSYQGLLYGNREMGLSSHNSPRILQMFSEIEAPFQSIVAAASRIIQANQDLGISIPQRDSLIHEALEMILTEEAKFLRGMDQIVFQYDQEAHSRVEFSKRIEWFILWSALFVLLLEGLFIFRPAVRRLSKTIIRLKKEQAKAQRLTVQLRIKNEKLNLAFTEILDISEQERRRIAQDVHDGLSQEISGIACMTKALQKKMEQKAAEEVPELREINRLMSEAISHTREIARGLYPISIDGDGLCDKLKDLFVYIERVFRIRCHLTCPDNPLPIQQQDATHLYCITQEAIHNAIRHGKAQSIHVTVQEKDGSFSVSIADDGEGFPAVQEGPQGLGLRIMKYRSELMHGQLDFSKNEQGGITVTCEIQKGVSG